MATTMWDRTEEMAKKHDQAGSIWLKLAADGDTAVVVFLGDPYPREVCFVDGRYAPFDENLKAQGLKPSLRVALNVALFQTKEMKVLEQGVTFFKDLVRVREKYGLHKWAFEIRRHGAAKDPKTTYSILPERELTAEDQKTFQSLHLQNLEQLYRETEGSDAEGAHEGVRGTAASQHVDPKTAQSISVVLKSMPKEAVERFCKKFGIARIKDLPGSKTADAIALLDEMEAQFGQPTKAAAEIDPFA
jgi:hypothetical protein